MANIYLEQVLLSFPRPISTLLRHDGSEFAGGCSVNKIKIPHLRSFNIVRERADNARSFIEMGDRQGRMQGFEIDAYSEVCVEQIYAHVGQAGHAGIFLLERPGVPGMPALRNAIRFFYEDFATHFELVTETRSTGAIQWHRAAIQNVEVLSWEGI